MDWKKIIIIALSEISLKNNDGVFNFSFKLRKIFRRREEERWKRELKAEQIRRHVR